MTARQRLSVTAAVVMIVLTSVLGCGGEAEGPPVSASAAVPTQASATPGPAETAPEPTTSTGPAEQVPGAADTTVSAAAFADLEARFDARLAVYAVDTGSERAVAHRADERFAYASTFKALAAGVLLQQTSDAQLDTVVNYTEADLVTYSPITEGGIDSGMTLRELADAAVRYSDNTAANLLLQELGGPAGLQLALRRLGDDVTQVDRFEPDLNEATPGDDRDTSTARALAGGLRELAVEDTLTVADRAVLDAWLQGNTTGDDLVRAGVPEGWVVGDKTGAGGYGTRNDIAVLRPPGREPLVIAVLSSRDESDAGYDDALVAEAARVAVTALSAGAWSGG